MKFPESNSLNSKTLCCSREAFQSLFSTLEINSMMLKSRTAKIWRSSTPIISRDKPKLTKASSKWCRKVVFYLKTKLKIIDPLDQKRKLNDTTYLYYFYLTNKKIVEKYYHLSTFVSKSHLCFGCSILRFFFMVILVLFMIIFVFLHNHIILIAFLSLILLYLLSFGFFQYTNSGLQ